MVVEKGYLTVLILLLFPVLSFAQRYDFKTISVNQGLPHGQVHQIQQTADQYIWMGTNGGGLVRYDGHNFKTFTEQDGLQNNAVHRIMEDSKGNLWIANDPGGIVTFKGDSLINPFSDEKISEYEVWSMAEITQGELWFGTYRGGIFIYEDEQLKQFSVEDGLADNSIWDIYKDNSGKIWLGTEEGLTVLSDQDTTNYTTRDGLSGNRVYKIVEDDSGTFWIATNNGITLWREGQFEAITSINETALDYVFDIEVSSSGDIWIGTETKGVFVYDGDSYTHFTRKNGLSSNYIYDLYEDHAGTMWVATNENGASLYKGEAFQFYDKDFGLASNAVLSVFFDRDGTLWLGTQEGIQSYDGEHLRTHKMPNNYENNYIWEIEQLPGGDMLFLMPNNELKKYDGNRFSDFLPEQNQGNWFIYDVFIDADNQIWIGSDEGLHILADDELQTFTTDDGLAGNVIQHIYHDKNGKYYLSTTSGLSIFDGNNFKNITIEDGLNNNTIHYATKGPDNNIWLGTSGGVSLLKEQRNSTGYEIDNFGKQHGMTLLATHFLWFDEQGYLWQGTNGGLNRLNVPGYISTNQMELIRYGLSADNMGVEFNFQAIAEDSEQNIWMGSMNGALKLDVSKLKHDQENPATIITNIERNGKRVDWTIYSEELEYSQGQMKFPSVTFPSGEHSYRFSFVGINYRSPENIRYRYKVEGFEEEWKPITSENTATYTNLEPGDYTFKVQALLNGHDKPVNTSTASYSFSIAYPFWQTNWFIGFAIIALVGIIYGYIRVRVGMLEKQRLQQLVDEQTRDLQEALEEKEVLIKEIHHRVKNNLAVISGLFELQMDHANDKFVDRILSESQRRVQSISMIHEKLYQNERLAEIDFEKYVQELIEIISYSFNNPEKDIDVKIEIDEFKLGVDQGIPSGLILNELISNAYEHAFKGMKSGIIEIKIVHDESNNSVKLIVRDNGIGFPDDFDIKQKETLGLTLIKTLVKQLEGTLDIQKPADGGTAFIISFEKESISSQLPIA